MFLTSSWIVLLVVLVSLNDGGNTISLEPELIPWQAGSELVSYSSVFCYSSLNTSYFSSSVIIVPFILD